LFISNTATHLLEILKDKLFLIWNIEDIKAKVKENRKRKLKK
jgi:hypothetical protein